MASRPLFLDFALLGFAPLVLVLMGIFFLPTESGAGDRAAFAPRPAEDPAASLKEKKRKGNRLGSSVVSGFGGRLSARAFVAHLAETAGASASDAERRSFRRIRKALFFSKTKQNSYLRFLLGKGGGRPWLCQAFLARAAFTPSVSFCSSRRYLVARNWV